MQLWQAVTSLLTGGHLAWDRSPFIHEVVEEFLALHGCWAGLVLFHPSDGMNSWDSKKDFCPLSLPRNCHNCTRFLWKLQIWHLFLPLPLLPNPTQRKGMTSCCTRGSGCRSLSHHRSFSSTGSMARTQRSSLDFTMGNATLDLGHFTQKWEILQALLPGYYHL
jgi:hypothetical protein